MGFCEVRGCGYGSASIRIESSETRAVLPAPLLAKASTVLYLPDLVAGILSWI